MTHDKICRQRRVSSRNWGHLHTCLLLASHKIIRQLRLERSDTDAVMFHLRKPTRRLNTSFLSARKNAFGICNLSSSQRQCIIVALSSGKLNWWRVTLSMNWEGRCIWYVFRMAIHGEHLDGFIDHVRVFLPAFCLCWRRFPTQHQHSEKNRP